MENIFDTQDELDQYGVWVKTPPQDASEEETEKTEAPVTESNENKDEEVSLDSLADGEVSLDEFLSDSDSSQGSEIDVSAFLSDDSEDNGGDKNFQPDGEISLDAFLDEADLGGESQEVNQESDEVPLDIDLSFDDTMPDVSEDESDFSSDDIDLDSFMADENDTFEDTSSSSGEELVDNFDEMFSNIEDTSPKTEEKRELPEADTESVDLSEFGVTGEDMEMSSVDNSSSEKKEQQDFNLNVDDDGLDKSTESVGGESADEDISINMEVKEDNGQSLAPDEKNPYSAPDDDFDIDGLLNSIEDETDNPKTETSIPIPQSEETTLPQNDNEETQIIVTDPEDDGVSMSIPENAVESEEVADFEGSVNMESTEDKVSLETPDIFANDEEPVIETEEPEIEEPVVEPPVEQVEIEETEPAAETSPSPLAETEDFSVDAFMGEEGFSDPSVAEGNRSYSPEELEEQERLKEEQAAEEIDSVAGEVDRENEKIDEIVENDVNLVNQLEKEMEFVDVDGDGENDADLIIDASVGETSNEIIDDEDFMPNPFYTPLVEDEGTNTPHVESEDSDEDVPISEDSEENSKEIVAENENKSNNSIVADDEEDSAANEFGTDQTLVEATDDVQEPDLLDQDLVLEEEDLQSKYISDAAGENMDNIYNTTRDDVQDSLMNQIANELSTLKEEIKELKLEFDELRKNGFSSGTDNDASASIPAPEAETGFFGDEDDDDTIALSGDELSNILSTAEFTAQNDSNDTNILGSIEEAPAVPDHDYDNAQNGLSMDYSDDNLQEPDLNSVDVNSDSISLPDEISLPKNDYEMEETAQNNIEPLDRQVDNSITEDNFEYLSEDPNTISQEDEKLETGISEEPVRAVFDDWQNPNEDSAAEETASDETAFASGEIEEPTVVEPTFDEPEPADSIVDIPSQEEDTMEEVNDTVTPSSSISSIPEDMKQEIKSVLSYMDQLLESLPEDKIEEFARSEQFATYKKLFNELGLS
ncbi:MAG: hypothetical protein J6Y69_03245 [Treponema sp.]|nr:hypothetical protein [Treponema sp.]